MHIPDGFLSTPVWACAGVVSLPGVAYFARRSRTALEDGQVPLMGVMGAFVFAAQMINFPVGVGTSGHLVGGALLAITLGPAAACVVMTAILTVQALLFQDGGVLALGANVFNMAIAGVVAGYLPYRYWGATRHRRLAIFCGGFLSVFVSACLAMSQLLLSGVPMPPAVAMLSLALFALSAAMEGGITLAVAGALERLNPRWVRGSEEGARAGVGFILVTALLLASVGALLASALPDGLERLAENVGIAGQAKAFLASPFADYEARFLQVEWLRKAVAGILGLGVVYAACLGLGKIAARRSGAARSV
ncbi:MAG: energy-coupling factor ABC transporter permease [Bryobacterales bacterium]|nr:energy-coupling factor ABC transporter permease [Bryobacterales bacterium]